MAKRTPALDLRRYAWRNGRRDGLYGRIGVIEARGKLGSVLVRWEDGSADVVSRRALRKVSK